MLHMSRGTRAVLILMRRLCVIVLLKSLLHLLPLPTPKYPMYPPLPGLPPPNILRTPQYNTYHPTNILLSPLNRKILNSIYMLKLLNIVYLPAENTEYFTILD